MRSSKQTFLCYLIFIELSLVRQQACTTLNKFVPYSDPSIRAGYIQEGQFALASRLQCAAVCGSLPSCQMYGTKIGSGASNSNTTIAGNSYSKDRVDCFIINLSQKGDSFTPAKDVFYRKKISNQDVLTTVIPVTTNQPLQICGDRLTEATGSAASSGWDVICYMATSVSNTDDPCYQLLENLESAAEIFPDEGALRLKGGDYACETYDNLADVAPGTLCQPGKGQDITINSRCPSGTCQIMAVCLQFP